MKKLLLIGAMLVLGASSFGNVFVDLVEDTQGSSTYSGKGILPVVSRGKIVKNVTTDVVTLVVEATTTTGADNNSLEFNFGRLTKGDSKVVLGGFQAKVYKGTGNSVKELKIIKSDGTSAISTEIINPTGDLKNLAQTNIGKITYTLSPGSDLNNDKTIYTGEIAAQLALNADTPLGRFEHNTSSLKVKITGLNGNQQ